MKSIVGVHAGSSFFRGSYIDFLLSVSRAWQLLPGDIIVDFFDESLNNQEVLVLVLVPLYKGLNAKTDKPARESGEFWNILSRPT
jgi:hypothetical protein